MALTPISDNLQCQAPKVLDNRSGRFSSGQWRPYNDLAEFLAAQPLLSRPETLIFWVRSTTDATKADLYTLDSNKTPYKPFDNAIALNRTPIPITVDASLEIDWQNDLVPSDPLGRTYAERFGNIINGVTGNWLVETNTYQGYQPEYTFTIDGDLIDTVSFPLLQTGFINFL